MTQFADQPIYQTLIEKLEAAQKARVPGPLGDSYDCGIGDAIRIIRTHLSNQPPVDADLRAVKEALEDITRCRYVLDKKFMAVIKPPEMALRDAIKAADKALSLIPAIEAALNKPPVKSEWGYCPECGNIEFQKGIWREGNKEHICTNCGQSWFPDIDYTDCVRANLAERKAALNKPKVRLSDCGQAVDDCVAVITSDDLTARAIAKAVLDNLKEQGVQFDVE